MLKKFYGFATGQALKKANKMEQGLTLFPGGFFSGRKQSADCYCFDSVKVEGHTGRYKPGYNDFYDGKE